jgi:hypothetical protein
LSHAFHVKVPQHLSRRVLVVARVDVAAHLARRRGGLVALAEVEQVAPAVAVKSRTVRYDDFDFLPGSGRD